MRGEDSFMFDYDPASKRAADKLDEYDLSELLLRGCTG